MLVLSFTWYSFVVGLQGALCLVMICMVTCLLLPSLESGFGVYGVSLLLIVAVV